MLMEKTFVFFFDEYIIMQNNCIFYGQKSQEYGQLYHIFYDATKTFEFSTIKGL